MTLPSAPTLLGPTLHLLPTASTEPKQHQLTYSTRLLSPPCIREVFLAHIESSLEGRLWTLAARGRERGGRVVRHDEVRVEQRAGLLRPRQAGEGGAVHLELLKVCRSVWEEKKGEKWGKRKRSLSRIASSKRAPAGKKRTT